MLTARQGKVLGRALKFLAECHGDACTPVREAVREVKAAEVKVRLFTCKSGCSCAPCKKQDARGPVPKVRATLVESHPATRAAAILRTAITKLRDFKMKPGLSGYVDGEGMVHSHKTSDDGTLRDDDGDVIDRVPAGSLKSDLQRKRALRKVMSPDEEADSTFAPAGSSTMAPAGSSTMAPAGSSTFRTSEKRRSKTADVSKRAPDVDAWQTDEGENPPGIIYGDPVLSPTLSEDDGDGEGDCPDDQRDENGNCPGDPEYDEYSAGDYLSEGAKRRAPKRKSEAVRAFEASAGDGMEPTGGETPVLGENPDADGRITPEQANYRYSAQQGSPGIPAVRCGTCASYVPDAPDNPDGGGACEKVLGLIRSVDVCNLYSPRQKTESARRAVEHFEKGYQD